MIKKCFLFGLALLLAGQFLVAQTFQMTTVSADGEKATFVLSDVQKIVFDDNTMTVNMKSGDDVPNIKSISFDYDLAGVDYSKLKINEVSGVGDDPDKFYELINIGDVDIPLEGCKIFYNANGSVGGLFPPTGNQGLTWTGLPTHIAEAGKLFCLIGRDSPSGTNPGSFTTGLTAQRILIIDLYDPNGNLIDQCIRGLDTDEYAFTDKSFSRIPDGTGPFYFTTPTPCEMNGDDATGLILVPNPYNTGIKNLKVESSVFVFPNPVREYLTVNGVIKGATINLYDLNGGLLQTTIAQGNPTNINVSSLQKGIYLLSVGGQTIKFVKQ